ncbi:hypothetical protein INR49_021874 [Caranx melampygus]|nr:hypothetical protein INR49_021874 [Caranx melampygus]
MAAELDSLWKEHTDHQRVCALMSEYEAASRFKTLCSDGDRPDDLQRRRPRAAALTCPSQIIPQT